MAGLTGSECEVDDLGNTVVVWENIYPVQTLKIGTPRSTLDLLSLPLPFSEVGILEIRDFIKEADQLRLRLDEELLEELDKRKILAPFYVVTDGADKRRAVDTSACQLPPRSGLWSRLVLPASKGFVRDPGRGRFQPWRRRSRTIDVNAAVYYSRHQLLLLEAIRPILGRVRTVSRESGPGARTFLQLAPDALPARTYEEGCNSWRSLAIALSALDTAFWPEIVRHLRWAQEWVNYRDTFDAAAILRWLKVSQLACRQTARYLLNQASFGHDLGEFYELVRLAEPSTWESIRGRSRGALDYTLAAEILFRTVEEVQAKGRRRVATQGPDSHRISARPRGLDVTLTRMGLSPFPSVLVVVEGETEYLIFPKVMESLGTPLRPNWVWLENRSGIDRKVQLLARYAARPMLGQDHGDFVLLDRPPTRVLLVVDPEKGYQRADKRRKERESLCDLIAKEVPDEFRKDITRRSSRMVTILTWGKYPFEFAHFTDHELARGLQELSKTQYPGGSSTLVKAIKAERKRSPATSGASGPNIETIWKRWHGPSASFSKPVFASKMWPILEKKLQMSVDGRRGKPPIMKVAIRAQQLATLPRTGIALSRKTT